MDTKAIGDCDLTGAVLMVHLPVSKGDADLREMRDYAMDRVFTPQPEGTVTSADSAFGSGES